MGMSQSSFIECPICGELKPKITINQHVETCMNDVNEKEKKRKREEKEKENERGKEKVRKLNLSVGNSTTSTTTTTATMNSMTTRNENMKQQSNPIKQQPLAERCRPKSLKEFIGQTKVIGINSLLRNAIESDQVPSLIFWGPPGKEYVIYFN